MDFHTTVDYSESEVDDLSEGPFIEGGALRPGEVVGGYVIESLIGAGGMGVVYRARDPELQRSVALKVISHRYAADARRRESFISESLAAAALEHPHVVPVYRAGAGGERLYIAMRLIDGGSLEELLTARGRLPAVRDGRLTGWATTLAFFPAACAVAETENDMRALILGALAANEAPASFLLPTRQADFFRWCLREGPRVVKPMTYMSMGEYREPDGCWVPQCSTKGTATTSCER